MSHNWKVAYWMLLVAWIIGALLFMNHVNAGFLNSYLSDVAFPPWFYIQIRGLHRNDQRPASIPFFGNWFGLTPWRAALSIFAVGAISELLVLVWPRRLTSGTFDVYDICAYAAGLFICLLADLRQRETLTSSK